MTLSEKIMVLYPQLTTRDFHPFVGSITLRNDADGRGDYIAKWEHPTLPKPTEEQLV